MPLFHANADYEEKDSHPLYLRSGDEVTAGPEDCAWPGWIWVTDAKDRAGYVPGNILQALGGGRHMVTADFDPSVLTIKRGDQLESLRQIHGWHWCRNEGGREGWVAGYLLRPV